MILDKVIDAVHDPFIFCLSTMTKTNHQFLDRQTDNVLKGSYLFYQMEFSPPYNISILYMKTDDELILDLRQAVREVLQIK